MSHNQPKHTMADHSGVLFPNPKSNDETVDYINSQITEDEVKSTNSITDTLHAKQNEIDCSKADNKTIFDQFSNLLLSVQNDNKILMEKIKNLEENKKKYELTLHDISYENSKLRDELDKKENINLDKNITYSPANTNQNSNHTLNLENLLEKLITNQVHHNNNNTQYKEQVNNTNNSINNVGYEYNNNIDQLIKKFKRFETIKNPRNILHYFREEFHRLGIHNDEIKYNILIERWPTNDVSNYYTLTSRENRNYTTFCEYCENRDDHLTEVLGKIPQYDNTTPFSVYLADATKWAESTKNDLIKFFAFYLAPKSLKAKIRENFDENFEKFVKKSRTMWNNREEESVYANPISVDTPQKNYYKHPKRNFKPREVNTHCLNINNNNKFRHYSQQQSQNSNPNNNERNYAENFYQKSQDFHSNKNINHNLFSYPQQINSNFNQSNDYNQNYKQNQYYSPNVNNNQNYTRNSLQNNQNFYQNINRNNLGNQQQTNQNFNMTNNQVDLCVNHNRYGSEAHSCFKPNSCPMAHLTAQRPQQGNFFPSFRQ